MNKMFLLIVVSVLLIAPGFGQALVPSSDTDQASIKGCLGGSDGGYIITEDGTTQTFEISSTAVDLKAHVGHDVEVVGQKATTTTSSGSSDTTVVVTAVNMISEHCATASAATASTPTVADPAATATASTPAVIDSTPTATASAPAASDPIPAATASTPATPDPSQTGTASTVTSDPTPAATTGAPAEAADAPMMASASAPESAKHLPDTATSLPLLGLLGLGLLATGLLSRSSRTN